MIMPQIQLAASWCEVVSTVALLIAGTWSMWKWNVSLRIRRAEVLEHILSRLRSNEISDFIYKVEYSEEWYTCEFHGSDFEPIADRALSFFCDICYLMKNKLVGHSESVFFAYELKRVLSNSQTIDYLYNLHHFARRANGKSSFYALEEYAKKNGFVDTAEFDDPDAYRKQPQRFNKFLNW